MPEQSWAAYRVECSRWAHSTGRYTELVPRCTGLVDHIWPESQMAEDTQHTAVAVRMDHTLGAELEVEHRAAGSTTELVVGQLQFPGLGVDLSVS